MRATVEGCVESEYEADSRSPEGTCLMILKKLATTSLAVILLSSTAGLHAQYGPPQGPPPPGYGPGGGWDAPPPEIANDAMRRGFHDGIEGARKDYENHRAPNVNNRDEFRHPDVPREIRHDYRMGFRRGYDAGVRHMMGGGPR
jgi:hypothetical protein